MDGLRIDDVAVREFQIRRPGELRSNRDENKVRDSLDCLERISDLSKDDDNDNNSIINRNNGKWRQRCSGEEEGGD